MAEKREVTVRKLKLSEYDEALESALEWQGRTPDERIAEVERLRMEYWGEEYFTASRLLRLTPIVKRRVR